MIASPRGHSQYLTGCHKRDAADLAAMITSQRHVGDAAGMTRAFQQLRGGEGMSFRRFAVFYAFKDDVWRPYMRGWLIVTMLEELLDATSTQPAASGEALPLADRLLQARQGGLSGYRDNRLTAKWGRHVLQIWLRDAAHANRMDHLLRDYHLERKHQV